jgi:hypothetical protein
MAGLWLPQLRACDGFKPEMWPSPPEEQPVLVKKEDGKFQMARASSIQCSEDLTLMVRHPNDEIAAVTGDVSALDYITLEELRLLPVLTGTGNYASIMHLLENTDDYSTQLNALAPCKKRAEKWRAINEKLARSDVYKRLEDRYNRHQVWLKEQLALEAASEAEAKRNRQEIRKLREQKSLRQKP